MLISTASCSTRNAGGRCTGRNEVAQVANLRITRHESAQVNNLRHKMPNEFQHIRFNIDDRVARITFARPPLNIFDIEMMREIGDALNDCAQAAGLAAIVFDATPDARAFSAGVAVEEHVPETV